MESTRHTNFTYNFTYCTGDPQIDIVVHLTVARTREPLLSVLTGAPQLIRPPLCSPRRFRTHRRRLGYFHTS